MSSKRIFVLDGHPAETSLSRSITETYVQAAKQAGHQVRLTHLHDLDFDVDYGFSGYENRKPLEADLQTFQSDLEWADHVVMAAPMWWGGMPAKLKGLFDRTLLPGWAFDTRKLKMGMPTPMLTGKTARAFITSDTPDFLFGLLYRKALLRQIKLQVFHFIGLKPAKITHFAPATKAGKEKVDPWLKQAHAFGLRGV